MSLSVGIDMTDVREISASLRLHGDRYLEAVFTKAERRDCGTSPRRLAERFAAKEAAMKAMACDERLPWHSLSVTRGADGRLALALSGAAAHLARARGIGRLSVSFAHAGSDALAIVLAS